MNKLASLKMRLSNLKSANHIKDIAKNDIYLFGYIDDFKFTFYKVLNVDLENHTAIVQPLEQIDSNIQPKIRRKNITNMKYVVPDLHSSAGSAIKGIIQESADPHYKPQIVIGNKVLEAWTGSPMPVMI